MAGQGFDENYIYFIMNSSNGDTFGLNVLMRRLSGDTCSCYDLVKMFVYCVLLFNSRK